MCNVVQACYSFKSTRTTAEAKIQEKNAKPAPQPTGGLINQVACRHGSMCPDRNKVGPKTYVKHEGHSSCDTCTPCVAGSGRLHLPNCTHICTQAQFFTIRALDGKNPATDGKKTDPDRNNLCPGFLPIGPCLVGKKPWTEFFPSRRGWVKNPGGFFPSTRRLSKNPASDGLNAT